MAKRPETGNPLTRICTKCGHEKHLMEFYLDYHRGKRRPECKACKRAQVRRYREAHGPLIRANARAYYAAHREECRERQRRWRQRHPGKAAAPLRRYRRRHAHKELVRRVTHGLHQLGLLDVGDRCQDCGGAPIELHHPDYNDPLRVIPLCRACHMRRHWARWRGDGAGPVCYPEEYVEDDPEADDPEE